MCESQEKQNKKEATGKCFNCGGSMNEYAARYSNNNALSSVPTHILAAVELIRKARNYHNIPSENWAYPVLAFGNPRDPYYAEIWTDGMDWQNSYWLIESANHDNPKAWPLLIFSSHDMEERIPHQDLREIFKAIMWRRRDKFWIKQNDEGVFSDTVWWALKKSETKDPEKFGLKFYTFEHASCPKTTFLVNEDMIYKEENK